MGWTAAEVRAATMADVLSCFDGYLKSRGVSGESKYVTQDERIMLRAFHRKMMRKIEGEKAKNG